MERHFQIELDKLRLKALEMAAYSEKAVDRAVRALLERNTTLAQEVIDMDHVINRLESDVDEESLRLLALAQPVAGDLRFVVGCMRMIVNLERIGDEAVNIAERALILSHRPALPFNHALDALGAFSLEMLRSAVKSFKDDDPELAERVCEMDSKTTEMDLALLKRLIDFMLKESPAIERSVHTILTSRSMERVANLATNVAECVIFIVKGVDVRHHCSRI